MEPSTPAPRDRSATGTDTPVLEHRPIRSRESLPIRRLACSRRRSSPCLACTVPDARMIPQRAVHGWRSLTHRSLLRGRSLEPAQLAFRLQRQPKSRSVRVDSRDHRSDITRDSESRWCFVRQTASARTPIWRIALGPSHSVSVVAARSACRGLRVHVMARHLA